MQNKKIVTIAVLTIAAVLIAVAFVFTTMGNGGSASSVANCLPTSLNAVSVKYPLKQPALSSMPIGYNLRAVDNPGDAVVLFYADHSLCPFEGSFDAQIDKGAIVVTISQPEGAADNSTDFQQKELKYYASQKEILADVKAIEVNGNKGVGWGPFTGVDRISINGTVTESHPLPMPGMIRFYNDQDHTIYSVTAHQPLDKLLEIARSIK